MKTYPLTHICTPSSRKPCAVDSMTVVDLLGNLSIFKTIETVKPLIQLPGFFTHDTPSRSSKSTTLWFLINLSPLLIYKKGISFLGRLSFVIWCYPVHIIIWMICKSTDFNIWIYRYLNWYPQIYCGFHETCRHEVDETCQEQ